MTKCAIEGALLGLAVVGLVGGVVNRFRTNKGIGVRFLQYLGVAVLLPMIAILSLEERVSQEMTGAIAATAVGGIIASIGKDE